MARRARFVILLVLFVSGAVIAGDNIVAPAATNNISESTLPDLGSESVLKEQHNNEDQSIKEKGVDYFINSATQGFENLTPDALKSQAQSYLQNQITSSTQSYIEGLMSPYGKYGPVYLLAKGAILMVALSTILFPYTTTNIH